MIRHLTLTETRIPLTTAKRPLSWLAVPCSQERTAERFAAQDSAGAGSHRAVAVVKQRASQ
jgi:hypothetical protein